MIEEGKGGDLDVPMPPKPGWQSIPLPTSWSQNKGQWQVSEEHSQRDFSLLSPLCTFPGMPGRNVTHTLKVALSVKYHTLGPCPEYIYILDKRFLHSKRKDYWTRVAIFERGYRDFTEKVNQDW